MRGVRFGLGLVSFTFLVACHPLSCFHPPSLPRDAPLELPSNEGWPRESVDVLIGELGIPHIYGNSEPDLAYGVGFMHARDRLFQVILLRAAAQGRLTEIFGADLLSADQELRLLTYRLDEQLAGSSEAQWDLMEAYCAGMNAGAAHAGKSAEMQILGIEFEPFTPRDVLSVARLQTWDLATGMWEELARARVAARIPSDDPRYALLTQPAPTGDRPVVSPAEHTGAVQFAQAQTKAVAPAPAERQAATLPTPKAHVKRTLRAQEILRGLGLFNGRGASNVWAVSGAHTEHGFPVVAHDPHLSHRGPGVFYMLHMEGPDFSISGGSFPGLPGVLIGHGDHIAWGIPVSNADSQDLVRIVPYYGQEDLYWLDGAAQNYGHILQRYKLGKEDDAPVVEELWKTTVFGPVLPPGFDYLQDEGEQYALMWTGFDPFGTGSDVLRSFWNLARAKNVDEATAALQQFIAPPMSLGMAFTDGTIAYRLSGDIPLRKSDESTGFPRDGSRRDAGWSGRLPAEYKPQLTNPAKGYLVAANQRVVAEGGPQAVHVGFEGATPYRARRIHERLEALLADGHKATTDEILAIQQDIESIEARELAAILGAACPARIEGHDEQRAAEFCSAVADFDAKFDVDSEGALPFTWLWEALQHEILRTHLGEDVADQVGSNTGVVMALHAAVTQSAAGEPSPLLDDPAVAGRQTLADFVGRVAGGVLDRLVQEAGPNKSDWRWGNHHRLAIRSPLNSAPAIGFLFETASREESGCTPCVRSERGTPVTRGAALRIIGEMDPQGPKVRLVNDSGNSGHFGHRHLEDQAPLWSEGKPVRLRLGREEVESQLEGWVRFGAR